MHEKESYLLRRIEAALHQVEQSVYAEIVRQSPAADIAFLDSELRSKLREHELTTSGQTMGLADAAALHRALVVRGAERQQAQADLDVIDPPQIAAQAPPFRAGLAADAEPLGCL